MQRFGTVFYLSKEMFSEMVRPVLFLCLLLCVIAGNTFAQEKEKDPADTTQFKKVINNIKESRVTKKVAESITRKIQEDHTAAVKSEELFMPYSGKIIRKIIINRITFEKNVTDTTRSLQNSITRIGNALHSNSKEWMIRDLLFFHEKNPLDPYKLADNERFLRDQQFIKDARIYVRNADGLADSVDVEVVTRDIFSIGGSFNPRGPTTTRFKIYDSNLAGMGQHLEFSGLVDTDRSPVFGSQIVYRKISVGGTLINATAGFTELDNGSSYGYENEKAYYLKLDRPLVSPSTRVAGGLEISRNWSSNVYRYADTLFRAYRYRVYDLWAGYNLSIFSRGRNRYFIAGRAFEQHFSRQPGQSTEANNPVYNDRRYLLGKITFFRQDFYKTKFIYGFGRTEDVPYGQTASLLFGVEKQLGIDRTYFGIEAEKTMAHHNGNFSTVDVRFGAFRSAHRFEDATMLFAASFFSKLLPYRKLLIRQSANINFTKVYNQRTSLPLDINGEFGLQNFRTDSLLGNKRLNVGFETLAFTPLKLLGFRFAGFTYGELAWLAKQDQKFWDRTPYYGLGGGVRTRNENLVFGTIELRFVYFPRVVDGVSQFKLSLTSNLRVKYTGTFVTAPSFISYN